MRISYKSLFGIRLRHSFYASGHSTEDFAFESGPARRGRPSAYGLVFKALSDGVAVLGEVTPDSDPSKLLKPLGDDALRFTFPIRTVSRHALNISDLPVHEPARSVFYFNNLRADSDDGRLLLGDSVADARVGAAVPLAAELTYTYRFQTPVNAASIEFRDLFQNVIHTLSFRLPDPALSTSEWRLNLGEIDSLLPGRYSLSDDHGGSHAFYFDPELFEDRPFAIIEIFSRTNTLTPDGTDRVPEAYRFLDGNELIGPVEYHIQLERRSTTWRYNVIKKYDSSDIDPAEVAIAGPVAFDKVVQSGRAVFTSSATVPLSDRPQALTLMRGGDKLRDLPNPGPTTMLQAGSTADNLVSDMYVYV